MIDHKPDKKGTPHLVRVRFQLKQDDLGYPPFESENMWATVVSGNSLKIDSVPYFSKDVSRFDEVEAREVGRRQYLFSSTVRRSGHSTYRVIPAAGFEAPATPDFLEYVDALVKLGCYTEWLKDNFVAIDVPPEVDRKTVYGFLKVGESTNVLEYETGHLFCELEQTSE